MPPDSPVPYLSPHLYVANTDQAWFDFLSTHAIDGVVDEVNFWQPKAVKPMKHFVPGEPIVFRLKRPNYAIAGIGFFAHFSVIDLDTAWRLFEWKNGDPDKERFLTRIGKYRGLDLHDPRTHRAPLGCNVLRDAHFWPRERWIPWREAEGWHDNNVQGATVRDPIHAARLRRAIEMELLRPPDDLAEVFTPLSLDERRVALTPSVVREGQGAFRLRLLSAYDNQCAITGEHTVPVLDAAHIQPYLGPRSNHPQNGIVLTKEFHVLFDQGYVGITPDYVVRVSDRLRDEFKNGHRYYPFDHQKLRYVPREAHARPSRDALAWHYERVFGSGH